MKKLLISAFILLTVPLSVACELKDPCDSGQEYSNGICIPEAIGGACGASDDGGQGGDSAGQEPNIGDSCECSEECLGGAVCGAPQLNQCVGLCGAGDPFEGACPDGLTCTDLGAAFLCW